jgi:peptidoglycan-associated lipoprotein
MLRTGVVIVLFVALLSSCAHKAAVATPPVKESTPVASAEPKPAAASAPAAPAEQSCTRDDDCASKALCIRNHCVPITPEVVLAECSVVRVHFAFDAWLLRDEDKPLLERIARCLRADQKLHVTIEGNADERGTEEYNLQLGAKRASGVERYLEALGVPDAQLKSISYGFEKPLCTEHNEKCWAENRRAGVKTQPGSH